MNCKPGDMAVIVRPRDPRNLGGIVRTIEHIEGLWTCEAMQTLWAFGAQVPAGELGLAQDSRLRPIRPSEGADETLTWKAVPKQPERVS